MTAHRLQRMPRPYPLVVVLRWMAAGAGGARRYGQSDGQRRHAETVQRGTARSRRPVTWPARPGRQLSASARWRVQATATPGGDLRPLTSSGYYCRRYFSLNPDSIRVTLLLIVMRLDTGHWTLPALRRASLLTGISSIACTDANIIKFKSKSNVGLNVDLNACHLLTMVACVE